MKLEVTYSVGSYDTMYHVKESESDTIIAVILLRNEMSITDWLPVDTVCSITKAEDTSDEF